MTATAGPTGSDRLQPRRDAVDVVGWEMSAHPGVLPHRDEVEAEQQGSIPPIDRVLHGAVQHHAGMVESGMVERGEGRADQHRGPAAGDDASGQIEVGTECRIVAAVTVQDCGSRRKVSGQRLLVLTSGFPVVELERIELHKAQRPARHPRHQPPERTHLAGVQGCLVGVVLVARWLLMSVSAVEQTMALASSG